MSSASRDRRFSCENESLDRIVHLVIQRARLLIRGRCGPFARQRKQLFGLGGVFHYQNRQYSQRQENQGNY